MIDFKSYFHDNYKGGDDFIENIILPIFGADKYNDAYEEDVLENNPELISMAESIGISQVLRLGTINIPMNPTDVFDITVTDHVQMNRNRLAVQVLIRRIMSTYSSAFMVFHYNDNQKWDWRFTFCSKQGNNHEITDSKRYTFLLGPNQSCRTAADNFRKLAEKGGNIELDDIVKAFDVEALSKEFFEKYKSQYEKFCKYIYENKDDRSKFGVAFSSWEDVTIRDYVKKLLGRIVFLHFLQKKGWMGVPKDKLWGEGDLQFMKNIFDNSTSAQKDNYLDEVLEPLFQKALDYDRSSSDYLYDTGVEGYHNIRIPYLNGGLFECNTLDEPLSVFPADYFKDLLYFFYEYNFTIDENDPNDAEVGVDPEMLGRIFENLLEDNKDKGAFYTPKEIVQYMCRESFINYLTTYSIKRGNANSPEEVEKAIRKLVHNPEEIVPKMTDPHKATFGEALRKLKICDPAIGSGAFPMGLLNELVRCRASIDAWAQDDSGKLLEGDYASLKREIVCNNIYGVDIERGAVDIARLRFWLSIIVDEHEPQTLPNLDYKIMLGNSLITTFNGEYVNLNTTSQSHVNVQKMKDEKKRLYGLKLQYYNATGETKQRLDIAIKDSILTLISLQLGYELLSWYDKHKEQRSLFPDEETKTVTFADIRSILPEDKQRICELGENLRKQLKDETIPLALRAQTDIHFFDWKIMFTEVFEGENSGFDIVIGNPPYIQLQNNGGQLSNQLKNSGFSTFASTGDIYCLFYEKGWQILKQNGHLCYITSNKWMRAGYGEKTRSFLVNKTNPLLLIDFSGLKIFESATVDTNILLFSKQNNCHKTKCVVTNKQSKGCIENLSVFVEQHYSINDFKSGDSWVILSPIEQCIKQKIEAVGTPLKDWDIQINYGIKTGYNDAFIISTEKRNEILLNCIDENERHRTEELIRPILRGRDIKRYGYEWADLWLIATFPSCHYDIEQYPAVKNYLLSYGIERLEQTGNTHIVKGEKVKARKKTSNKWFETQDSISYWEDFSKPKVLWKRVGSILRFCYNENLVLGLDSTCFATGKNIEFICCVLNSPMGHYLLKDAPKTGTGDLLISVQAVIPIMVPTIDDDINSEFSRALKLLINDNNTDIEKEISHKVFDLYGLSNEERLYIIENFS